MQKPPKIIEGTYSEANKRQPIFNNWRYAVPLLGLIALRTLWVLASHH